MENKNNRTRTLIGRLWMEENENGKYLSGSLDLDLIRSIKALQIRVLISKTKEKKKESSPDALIFGYLESNEQKETVESKKEELL